MAIDVELHGPLVCNKAVISALPFRACGVVRIPKPERQELPSNRQSKPS